ARREALSSWPRPFAGSDFAWVTPPVLNPFTRIAVEMCAANGTLRAVGYESEPGDALPRRATQVRELAGAGLPACAPDADFFAPAARQNIFDMFLASNGGRSLILREQGGAVRKLALRLVAVAALGTGAALAGRPADAAPAAPRAIAIDFALVE